MEDPGTLEVTMRVRNLKRSRALYRRLGFVEEDVDDGHACRLRRGDVLLVLTDRASKTDAPQRQEPATNAPRGGGVVLTVVVRDIDAVLAYWQEEGMLVVTGVHQGRTGRVFHGLDHDGYELRIEESDAPPV
jgi:catechol 2,3-dioxygenase-like lactoylglutathione lyase family enzyme